MYYDKDEIILKELKEIKRLVLENMNKSNNLDLNKSLSRKEAAEILGIKVGTLAKWHCTGERKIPYEKLGSKTIYRYEDLIKFKDSIYTK